MEKPIECVFCDIVAGRAEARFAEVFAEVSVIEPLYPVAPGHLLAIPHAHVADASVSPTVTGRVFATAAIAARGYDSYNLITSVGEPATQSVFHFHVHIIPRWPDDGLLLPWSHPDRVARSLALMQVEEGRTWSRESRSAKPS